MFGTRDKTLIMTTTKQDDIGYCFYVQTHQLITLKITRSEFVDEIFKLMWIKKLIGGKMEKLEVENSVFLEGVFKQFSDPAIDIFVDEDGIGKGLPRLAITPKGVELFGNVVVLGSDGEGETILLNKQQVEIVARELGFYQKYEKIEVGDITVDNPQYSKVKEVPQPMQDLAGLVIEYCVTGGLQMLIKAEGSKGEGDKDTALVACLHGDPELIDDCYKVLKKFVTKHLGNSENP